MRCTQVSIFRTVVQIYDIMSFTVDTCMLSGRTLGFVPRAMRYHSWKL